MKNKIIGLIPARGGSKGIPNKNIALLNNKPLIAYTIESAKQSKLDDVYCSSDSEKILKSAKGYGSKILKRPSELATDETSMLSVVKHFRDYLVTNNIEFDAIQVLYPTYPLRNHRLINQSIETYETNPRISIIGMHKAKTNPYLCYILKYDNLVSYLNIDINKYYRRQDYPSVYQICLAISIIPKSQIDYLNNQLFNAETSAFVINDNDAVIDIDTFEDMKYASFRLKEIERESYL